jgi:hypothetical protein
MVTPLAYFDLVETFPKPGCAVCNLVLRDVDHFLDSLLYERVNEPDSHRAFRARRGLCNEHAWQLIRYKGGALGIAILYNATLDEVLKVVEQVPMAMPTAPSGIGRFLNSSTDSAGLSLAERLEPTLPCPACELRNGSERGYVRVLSEYIEDTRLQEAYRASDGLCLPHFRQVLRLLKTAERFRLLVSVQSAIWRKLKADLNEFMEKNDHRRAHEAMGAEGDSWQRAARRMAGEKGVFGSDPRSA